MQAMGERLSPKKITAKAMAMMVEDLSIGLTKVTGARESAAKKQSHDAPVASPERKRNRSVRGVIVVSSDAKWPLMLIAATIHAPRKTTEVLNAVTSVESWPWIPSFASIAVMPAKNAEPKAKRSQIFPGWR